MYRHWIEDPTMLSLRRRFMSVAIFLFTLVILLALGLLFERVGDSDQVPLVWGTIKSSVGAAMYFLVMSGYGFLYPLIYVSLAQRLTVFQRRAVALALFSGCFVGFFLLFSDAWSWTQIMMFGVGLVSVLVADFVAAVVVLRSELTSGPTSLL